jgi:hypothetical protein
MKNTGEKSLKVYILENYEKYWDLSKQKYQELSGLLDAYNASRYTKTQFCRQFGLKDLKFVDLLRILTRPNNYNALVAMGQKYAPKEVVTRGRKRSH